MFVFGDNLLRAGCGGAAILRDHPRATGFITKKYPSHREDSYYKVEEYRPVFEKELRQLETTIRQSPEITFYISQLGGGLANRHKIWENIVRDGLEKALRKYHNVVFLWEKNEQAK